MAKIYWKAEFYRFLVKHKALAAFKAAIRRQPHWHKGVAEGWVAPHQMLRKSFLWNDTAEGDEYWGNLSYHWEQRVQELINSVA